MQACMHAIPIYPSIPGELYYCLIRSSSLSSFSSTTKHNRTPLIPVVLLTRSKVYETKKTTTENEKMLFPFLRTRMLASKESMQLLAFVQLLVVSAGFLRAEVSRSEASLCCCSSNVVNTLCCLDEEKALRKNSRQRMIDASRLLRSWSYQNRKGLATETHTSRRGGSSTRLMSKTID